MTLEDFFTLTELKDGLTTPARVNELLTVMQKEKECVVKNVGEATRQWSAVAKTIATTENKDCLNLFIQSDGLWFIDRWLKDAQKFGNDTENLFLEELIIALLRALERLQVDNHRSISSGIDKTIQGLLGHSSSMVREKAKAVCDGWTPVQDIDAAPTDVKMIEAAPVAISNEENKEQSSDEKMLKEEIPTQDTIMESATTDQDPVDSSMNVSENVAVKVESDRSKSESTVLTGISGFTPTVQSNISQLDKHDEDAKEKEKQEIDSLDRAGEVESTTVSSPLEHNTPPESADIEKTSEPDIEKTSETEKREETSDKDEDMMDGGDSSGGALQVSENKWGEADDPKTTSNTESDEEDAKKYVGIQSDDDSGNRSWFSKRLIKGQDGDLISKRTSDMELDYGMVDPLELARQVANEVEREVDSRERSCSTSQNISGSGIERPSSPDSTNEKEPESIGGSGKEVSSGSGPKGPPSAAKPVNDVEALVSKMESCEPNIPETQISEMAQESAPNAERGFSGFDLNQEVSSEETECRADPVLTPVSVVSASRAAASDGLPSAPLQFEGTLGWKGSAATSAFRRIPEVERAFTNNNSKQRLDRLDFDLNVAEGSEDVIEDLLSRDKMPITSFLEPSADEQRRLERLQLDLNSLGDGDTGTIALDWKRDGRVASLRQNGPQSPALSSSSSSMQPSFRNIDLNLNDHSTIPNNTSFDSPFLGKLFNNSNVSGGAYKRDESVISIFGTQVEVKRKDSVPVPNGRVFDPPVDFSLGRTGSGLGLGPSNSMPYANLPAYGHNGFALGPAMSFSTPMYGPPGGPIGPIPYMVDSRGAPIVPQLMGSSSSIPPPFSQPTQPFIFNMAASGAPSGSNGAGPSRHNFDLNSGFMSDGGNRENNGGLRQFFNHSQVRPVDEQQFLRMSNSLQASSSSVIGGKRQEPDSGWESFPINYKHHQQPPWQ
ncbi:hypothetical protein L6452_08349 [Arctium lappa]|uniref:Uncharacterized protein n=1 Tax=Arctium lappa TaxID=4217 RepID=A0ACB9DHB5_ARCLA|nr:hypothetical protein L6452_08349 [Arctium lappa]